MKQHSHLVAYYLKGTSKPEGIIHIQRIYRRHMKLRVPVELLSTSTLIVIK